MKAYIYTYMIHTIPAPPTEEESVMWVDNIYTIYNTSTAHTPAGPTAPPSAALTLHREIFSTVSVSIDYTAAIQCLTSCLILA